MSDDFSNELPRPRMRWGCLVLLVAVTGMGFAWFIREMQHAPYMRPTGKKQIHPATGKPMPSLQVQGWMNGDGPTAADLRDKAVVIEAWAYWCKPCLRAAPHTVALYEKFKDRGVVFLGLTTEQSDKLAESERFIAAAKFPWPCGYGADQTLNPLYDISDHYVPMLWVIDRQGVIVWGGNPLDMTEQELADLTR